MAPTTVVSAPGKVLAAGGYLVLDPIYSGVVISTSSRFYTVIQDDLSQKAQDGKLKIRVKSPQFVNATWAYDVVVANESGIKVDPASEK